MPDSTRIRTSVCCFASWCDFSNAVGSRRAITRRDTRSNSGSAGAPAPAESSLAQISGSHRSSRSARRSSRASSASRMAWYSVMRPSRIRSSVSGAVRSSAGRARRASGRCPRRDSERPRPRDPRTPDDPPPASPARRARRPRRSRPPVPPPAPIRPCGRRATATPPPRRPRPRTASEPPLRTTSRHRPSRPRVPRATEQASWIEHTFGIRHFRTAARSCGRTELRPPTSHLDRDARMLAWTCTSTS